MGWIHKFWPVSHSHTGGGTNGRWVLHSLHRLGYVALPLWTSFPALPSGNIRRVINTTEPGGTPAAAPSTLVDSLDILYPLGGANKAYLVPSVFMTSGFCTRLLSLAELFALWDLPHSLFKSLTRPQRVLLWKWNSIPPRVLGFLLRLFLSCKNETEGVLKGEKVVVKGKEFSLEESSKRCLDDSSYISRKRVKTFNSFHNKS